MKNNEIFLIGGGTSLKDFDFNKLEDKTTITINKSVFHVPNPNYFITEDFSFIIRLKRNNEIEKFRNIKTTKIFVAQLGIDYINYIDGKIVDTRFPLTYNLYDFDIIIHSNKVGGIGLTFNDFRDGKCSGYSALQLAVILGYNPINLLGIDLCTTKRTHYHEGYGKPINGFQKDLDVYYKYFKIGLKELKNKRPDLQVYSCSQNSRLNQIIPYRRI